MTPGDTGDADAAVDLPADALGDPGQSAPTRTEPAQSGSGRGPDPAPGATTYGDAAHGKSELLYEEACAAWDAATG